MLYLYTIYLIFYVQMLDWLFGQYRTLPNLPGKENQCWPWCYVKAKLGTQSPGPMTYGARTTFGKQSASNDRTAPVINFTRGKRVLVSNVFLFQSSWKFKHIAVMTVWLKLVTHRVTEWWLPRLWLQCTITWIRGIHVISVSHKTLLLIMFWLTLFNVLMVNGHQRTFDGASAGPGEYPIVGSVGLQPESQKLTSPSFSFPHCSRDRFDKVINLQSFYMHPAFVSLLEVKVDPSQPVG